MGCGSAAESSTGAEKVDAAKRNATWEAPPVTENAVGVAKWESESGGRASIILRGLDSKGAVKYAADLSLQEEGTERALVVELRSPAASRLTITKGGFTVSDDAVLSGPVRAALTAAALDAVASLKQAPTSTGARARTAGGVAPLDGNALIVDQPCALETGQGAIALLIRAVLDAVQGPAEGDNARAASSLDAASDAFDGAKAGSHADSCASPLMGGSSGGSSSGGSSSGGSSGGGSSGGGSNGASSSGGPAASRTAELYPCATTAYNTAFKCLKESDSTNQSVSWWKQRASSDAACGTATSAHLHCHSAFAAQGWTCSGSGTFACTNGDRRAVL